MSEPENFLARWSRLQARERAEQAPSSGRERRCRGCAATSAAARGASRRRPPEADEPAFDLASAAAARIDHGRQPTSAPSCAGRAGRADPCGASPRLDRRSRDPRLHRARRERTGTSPTRPRCRASGRSRPTRRGPAADRAASSARSARRPSRGDRACRPARSRSKIRMMPMPIDPPTERPQTAAGDSKMQQPTEAAQIEADASIAAAAIEDTACSTTNGSTGRSQQSSRRTHGGALPRITDKYSLDP